MFFTSKIRGKVLWSIVDLKCSAEKYIGSCTGQKQPLDESNESGESDVVPKCLCPPLEPMSSQTKKMKTFMYDRLVC